MKHFDFVVIGAGIAGLLSAYRLKEFNTLLIDKDDVISNASRAAGAFLFPKVGFDTAYTRFINDAILKSIDFYKGLGINTHTKGVLILPRDERDIEKFKKYEKEIRLPFKKVDNGFFFDIGSVIDPEEVKKKIRVNFEKLEVKKIEQKENYWIINEKIKTKNIILATGAKEVLKIPYIKIRAVWGERIEIKSDLNLSHYYHKNCSVGEIDGVIKIGATHKRDCFECQENEQEALELIKKAREIVDIRDYELLDIKGGFRAASIDYFPVAGKIIDVKKTLLENRHIVKGDLPKEIFYKDGLYIINGMGGRGFSNAVVCSEMLYEYIVNNKDLGKIDTKRLFIKWARKFGEEFLNAKS